MKSALLIFLTLFFIGTISCKNDDNKNPVQNKGLVGKWKLTAVLFDPGDGSGKFRTVSEAESGTVEFKANGDFSEIKGPIYSSVNPYNTYKILDDTRIELSIKDKPSMKTIWYYSNLSSTSLTLGYGCIEACSGKYAAVP